MYSEFGDMIPVTHLSFPRQPGKTVNSYYEDVDLGGLRLIRSINSAEKEVLS